MSGALSWLARPPQVRHEWLNGRDRPVDRRAKLAERIERIESLITEHGPLACSELIRMLRVSRGTGQYTVRAALEDGRAARDTYPQRNRPKGGLLVCMPWHTFEERDAARKRIAAVVDEAWQDIGKRKGAQHARHAHRDACARLLEALRTRAEIPYVEIVREIFRSSTTAARVLATLTERGIVRVEVREPGAQGGRPARVVVRARPPHRLPRW